MNPTILPLLAASLVIAPAALAQTEAPAKWQIEWTDHDANPVDLKSPGSRAYMPCVLYHEDWPEASRFRVWYDMESNNGLAYATSADGITWSAGVPLTGINTAETSSTGVEFAGRPVVLYNPEWEKPYRI